MIVGVLLTAYELYQQVDWSRAPVLNRDSFTSAWPMIFLAAGAFFAIGSAANRRHTVEDDDPLRGLPVSPTTQAVGVGLAFVSPLLVGLLMQGTVLTLRALDSSVTSLVWSEVLTGPVTVALGAAAGLAVGFGFRSALALPLAAVGLGGAVVTMWWANSGYLLGPYTPWLAPVTSLDWNQYAYEQVYRPSGPHLAYLLLLTGALGAAATIRGREDRGRLLSVSAVIVLLAGTVFFGLSQLAELTPAEEAARQALYNPTTADYVCEQRGTVTYCAYSGYEAWIDEWAAQVEPVIASIPGDIATGPIEVRQQIPYFNDDDADFPEPRGDIRAGMWWSRRPFDSSLVAHPLGMALAPAGLAVGLPTDDLPIRITVADGEIVAESVDDPADVDPEDLQYRSCLAGGQARAVAALWYGAHASPEAAEGLEFLSSGDRYGHVGENENFAIDIGYRQPASSVIYFRKEALTALDLFALPPDDVGNTFAQHWTEVTDPARTTEELAGWFGLSVPEMGDTDDMGSIPCP
jgi:hypothetical protein